MSKKKTQEIINLVDVILDDECGYEAIAEVIFWEKGGFEIGEEEYIYVDHTDYEGDYSNLRDYNVLYQRVSDGKYFNVFFTEDTKDSINANGSVQPTEMKEVIVFQTLKYVW